MQNPLLFFSLSLLSLASVQALPPLAHNARAEVDSADFRLTPGPGLPSLESLNLTIADLMSSDFLTKRGLSFFETPGLLTARDEPDCYDGPNFGEYKQIMWCYNYLIASGASCQARYAEHTRFCEVDGYNAGSWQYSWIVGDVVGGISETTTSSCADVAYGAAAATYGCAKTRVCSGVSSTFAGGGWTARGNGNMEVIVGGVWAC